MNVSRGILFIFLAAGAAPAPADVAIRVHADGLANLTVPPGTLIDFAVSATMSSAQGATITLANLEVELIADSGPGRLDPDARLFLSPGPDQATPSDHRGAGPKRTFSNRIPITALMRPNHPTTLLRSTVLAPPQPGAYRLRAVWRGATPLPGSGGGGQAAAAASLLRPGIVSDLHIEVRPNALAIVDSYPPPGAIDARQPWAPDGTDVAGWSWFELVFVGDTSRVLAEDFVVRHSAAGPAPQVESVAVDGPRVAIELSAGIEPAAWTSITHRPSGTSTRVGYLPGDVNSDRVAGTGDIVALIDRLHAQSGRPHYATDIDRDGETDADDLSRLLELLNGLEAYPVFLGTKLPE